MTVRKLEITHLCYTFTTVTTTTVLRFFDRDYSGEPVSEETFIHSHISWSSTILY